MERIKLKFTERHGRVSWGSIFAGVITVLGISILLAILASSISFFMFDPTDAEPASGIGTNVTIWTILALLISLAAGGFVAGKLAGADGVIHGFLVWATSLLVTVIVGMAAITGAVKMTANVLGSISSVAGNVISGVGGVVESGVSELSDQASALFDEMDINVDRDEIRRDVKQAMRRSGVREFQPEYVQREVDAVRSDLKKSVKRIAARPKDTDRIVDGFTNRLQGRIDKFAGNVNRDDVAKAIANNTQLSRSEAEETVDQYMELFENGRQQLENLRQSMQEARQEWERMKAEARESLNDAANAAGRGALWSFIALLIGGALAAFMGLAGTRMTKEGYEA